MNVEGFAEVSADIICCESQLLLPNLTSRSLLWRKQKCSQNDTLIQSRWLNSHKPTYLNTSTQKSSIEVNRSHFCFMLLLLHLQKFHWDSLLKSIENRGQLLCLVGSSTETIHSITQRLLEFELSDFMNQQHNCYKCNNLLLAEEHRSDELPQWDWWIRFGRSSHFLFIRWSPRRTVSWTEWTRKSNVNPSSAFGRCVNALLTLIQDPSIIIRPNEIVNPKE